MKMISWNVNGLRACLNKGFLEFVRSEQPDLMALQEIKMRPEQADFQIEGYHMIWNSAEKNGYSGTAVLVRNDPCEIRTGIGYSTLDSEGRCITLFYPGFTFVTVYTPNSQDGLRRLPVRMQWDDCFRDYVSSLAKHGPIFICGDMNVAHQEIDLKNPQSNHMNAGFSDEERAKFSELLESGFIDTFRYLYPETKDAYSWWSYRFRARERNAGWRIDYFLMRALDIHLLKDHIIYSKTEGSDHCPIGIVTEEL